MNIGIALGIFLLGAGLGALLIWIQQTASRRRFLQGLEAQINEAFFTRSRHGKLLDDESGARRAFKRRIADSSGENQFS